MEVHREGNDWLWQGWDFWSRWHLHCSVRKGGKGHSRQVKQCACGMTQAWNIHCPREISKHLGMSKTYWEDRAGAKWICKHMCSDIVLFMQGQEPWRERIERGLCRDHSGSRWGDGQSKRDKTWEPDRSQRGSGWSGCGHLGWRMPWKIGE